MKRLPASTLSRLAKEKRNPLPVAIIMSHDEMNATSEPWQDDLPDIEGGYCLSGTALVIDPSKIGIDRTKAAASTGNDVLLLTLADLADGEDGAGIGEEIFIRGEIVCVTEKNAPRVVHLSDVGAIDVWAVDIHPAALDRAQHPRTKDGRRIAAFGCVPLGNYHASMLLGLLASRALSADDDDTGKYVLIPSQSVNLIPGIPTVGEAKRRAKSGKGAPVKWSRIEETIRARRVTTGVRVSLDDMSMRLAAESFQKGTKHRTHALQCIIPFPAKADNEQEIQSAVNDALAHFDTDYLLSFDAVQSVLVLACANDSAGTALDEDLARTVAMMRFGPSTGQNGKQRARVDRHLETLRQVVLVVESRTGGKRFTGPLIVPTGKVDDVSASKPFRIGERVTLNPDLYPDLRRGRGLIVDTRYFLFDPYREDAQLRLYRYLASRWSLCSVKHAASHSWRVSLKLADALDMAGIDWRTNAQQRGRSENEARARIDAALTDLTKKGLIQTYRIIGEGISNACILHVDAPDNLQKAVTERRPLLHSRASAGTLKPQKAQPKKQSRTDSKRGRKPTMSSEKPTMSSEKPTMSSGGKM